MRLTQETQLEGAEQTRPPLEHRYRRTFLADRWHRRLSNFPGYDPKNRRGVVILAASSTSLIDALAKRMYGLLAGETVHRSSPTQPRSPRSPTRTEFQGMKLKIEPGELVVQFAVVEGQCCRLDSRSNSPSRWFGMQEPSSAFVARP